MADIEATVVVDASVLVDLLAGTEYAQAVRARLSGNAMHAPAHVDAEVLSAFGRLHRAGELSAADVETGFSLLTTVPMRRHPLSDLLAGAWGRRGEVRVVDGLYVELAVRLDIPLVTTDLRLARASPIAEAVPAGPNGTS